MLGINPTPKFVIALILCVAAGCVLAQPGWTRDKDQERPRQRQQAKEMRREEVRAAQRKQGPMQKRRTDAQDERRSQSNGQQGTHARNNGRMSPEERRALRRQISEANKSITYHHTGQGYP